MDRTEFIFDIEKLFARALPIPFSGCLLWEGATTGADYPVVRIGGRKGKTVLVTRIVLEKKLGRPLGAGMQACHTCDIPPCISPYHLWEGTMSENLLDAVAKGFRPIPPRRRGEAVNFAKLTTLQVGEIKEALELGIFQKTLAAKYAVRQSTISRIATGKDWAHV